MNKNFGKILFLFTAALLLVSAFALSVGSVSISFSDLLALLQGGGNENYKAILFDIRLPRILAAIAVGGGLSVAGAVLQAILKNPLAEPYILGVSGGGTFAALLSMLFGLSFYFTQLFAFGGSLAVIAVVIALGGKTKNPFNSTTLLLTGVMIGAFFGAAILIVLTLMRENLQTAVFWIVGSLSFVEPDSSYYVFLFALFVSLFLSFRGYRLNLIALGDEAAETLGVDLNGERTLLLAASGILTGGLVAVSGVIGFIGMIVPHLVRNKFGFDNRLTLPLSFLLGGSVLLLADTFARTVILPAELPVGAITAFFGAPLFVWFLKKKDYYFSS